MDKKLTSARARIPILLLVALPAVAMAGEKPFWELGAGVGVLSMPDYRGSNQRHAYALPIPYLVYRGDFLQMDRENVRGLLYKGERSEWDISVGATVPVKSDDNRARTGMPDLDPTVEIGPQWSYKLRHDWMDVTLRMPLRKVLAVDWPHFRDVGTVFTPTLALDRDDHPWPGWHASISTGPIFGDRDYFRYYYEVSPAFATPSRPAWNADSGYGGWQLTMTMTKRFNKLWVGGFLRGDYLGGAAFEDSPLTRSKRGTWMGGIGVAWVFAESSTKVDRP